MDEAARIATLKGYGILDTPNEPEFDRLVRHMATSFGVKAALISFIDADRQWYKARVGIDATEVPRAISFCTHSIERDGVTVVPDAQADPVLRHKPAAIGPGAIRFYAGAPITAPNGARIGTVCVFAPTPRGDLTAADRDRLAAFADAVVQLIETRRRAA